VQTFHLDNVCIQQQIPTDIISKIIADKDMHGMPLQLTVLQMQDVLVVLQDIAAF
jgi:hypothetical protein